MEIKPVPEPPRSLLNLVTTARQENAPPIRHGQTLQATVTSLLPDGRATLVVADRLLEVRSPLPLTVGQQLKLVAELSGDRLMLRLLDPPSPNAADKDVIAGALRAALPKQGDLGTLFRTLAAVMKSPPSPVRAGVPTEPPLPKEVLQLAKQILAASPSREQIATPEGLKSAVARSGLFLEARLAAGNPPPPGGDVKADLTRLAAVLRNLPDTPLLNPAALAAAPRPIVAGKQDGAALRLADAAFTILRQTEGALGRSRVTQFQTVERSTPQNPDWLMDIPVRGQQQEPDQLKLRIRREQGGQEGNDRPEGWSVTISHEDGEHGGLDMVVKLLGEEVSVTIWTEREETAELFSENLDLLHRRLIEAGLTVGRLASRKGSVPTEDSTDATSFDRQILDVKA